MSEKIILPNSFLSIAEEELNQGRSVRILADGKSMFPFIHGGKDVSEIEPLQPGEPLKLWHGYMFLHNGRYVIHRYVGEKEGQIIMSGDGNLRIVETVSRKDVIGHLKSVHTKNGKVIDCTSPSWTRRGRTWHKMRPVRRYLLAAVRRLYKYGIINPR